MPELVDVAPGSPEWQAARRLGVTATDIVTITGLSATDSAYALYWRKLQVLPEPGDTDRWRLGRELEPIIANRFMEATDRRWHDHGGKQCTCAFSRDRTRVVKGGLYRSDERSWQMATLDRASASEPVELKSWADADRARWDDGPPIMVRAQVLWQMDVMGVATGHVGVLFLPSGELRSYGIGHDHVEWVDVATGLMSGAGSLACQTCADIDALRKAGFEFLERLTDENSGPPSADGSAATLAALKARYATPVNDKVAVIGDGLWGAYEHHLEMASNYKRAAKKLEADIRESIGDAGAIEVDGEIVARRTISTIRAHYRKEGMRDCITRIKAKDEDNAEQ